MKNRFEKCVQELQRIEKRMDIKITDFILNNLRERNLFLTRNRPSTTFFVEILSQIKKMTGLKLSIDKLNIDNENLALLAQTNTPISPYDVEVHRYHFKHNSDWRFQGKQLIKLISKNYSRHQHEKHEKCIHLHDFIDAPVLLGKKGIRNVNSMWKRWPR